MQRIKLAEGGKGREGQIRGRFLHFAPPPGRRHRASARGNLRTSCVQRKPVDTLSRWEALGQARGDQGLRPLRHALGSAAAGADAGHRLGCGFICGMPMCSGM
jgi:hypothetical protein